MAADAAATEQILRDGPLSVGQAAKLLPSNRGRKVHTSTLVRWITYGKRGVKLEGYFGPGGTWWTSRQALARFLARLTARAMGETELAPSPTEEEEDRRRRAAVAMAKMRAMRGK